MRVLHVYSGNLFGGVERMLVTLARHADACPEMKTAYALCFPGRLREELILAGAEVHDLGAVRVRHPWTVRQARGRLSEVMDRQRPDVVVCHLAWSQAVFGPVVRRRETPLVFFLHGATNGGHWLERVARRTPPDLALCNSRFTAAMMPAMYPDSPTEVVYYPVELETLREADARRALRREFETPEDAVVVLQVGRVERGKGQLLHLQALQGIADVGGWCCWMVGAPQSRDEREYQKEIDQLASSLGVERRVRCLGARSDIARVMAASDVYCQPNVAPEGFGITFVEALYACLPVVTTRIGGALEIVDDRCGILVPPGDTAALTAALRRLIENAPLRRELGMTGPARARDLCCPAGQIVRLYEVLAANARARRDGNRMARDLAA